MANQIHSNSKPETISGVIYAGSAFVIWGLGPLYWKALREVPSPEIIVHRVIWSFLLLFAVIVLGRFWNDFVNALKNKRVLIALLSTAVILSSNWLLYVWAVNNNHMLQGSLGYYINPLVNVVFGVLFLKERLRRAQVFAVLLAAVAVTYLTVSYGEFPWIAIALASSFGLYGLIRKIAPVGALVGLSIETLLMLTPATIYFIFIETTGRAAFLQGGIGPDLLLLGTAVLTAVPLTLFTAGAKRINLSTVGLLQYIAPTGMFLLAVFYYHEPFSMAQVWTFMMIWTALIIYSADSLLYFRKMG